MNNFVFKFNETKLTNFTFNCEYNNNINNEDNGVKI